MDVKKLAQDLIPLVGGKDNIKGVLHCMTRLRFQLADMSKAILVIMVVLAFSSAQKF